MLYYTGLEEIVFSKHELLPEEPDELIIISGYLGPGPVKRLSELKKMKITLIGGMYSSGIDMRLLNSLKEIEKSNPALTIRYTQQEIHSKIYIWKCKNKTLSALTGSANFSSNGPRTDYRDSLADATRDTFKSLDIYYNFIFNHSSKEPKIKKNQKIIDYQISSVSENYQKNFEKKYSYDIPLYQFKDKHKVVPTSSGLNWGIARFGGSHTAAGDAYIRIPKDILINNDSLFKPFDSEFISPEGKRKRNSNPIELIWDDGTVMEASLEGIQIFNNKKYPKQLASYSLTQPFLKGKKISKKSILGRYIRNRLGVKVDEVITIDTLKGYGRDTITLSLIDEGVYYADFSI